MLFPERQKKSKSLRNRRIDSLIPWKILSRSRRRKPRSNILQMYRLGGCVEETLQRFRPRRTMTERLAFKQRHIFSRLCLADEHGVLCWRVDSAACCTHGAQR